MREFLGAEALANTVSMLMSSRNGAIWISHRDDEARFYEARCVHSNAVVLAAPDSARDVLTIVRRRGLCGAVATLSLRDAPFGEDEFALSHGDLSTLLCLSPSCTETFEGLSGRTWYSACDALLGGVRKRAVLAAHVLGEVRASMDISSLDYVRATDLLHEIMDWRIFEISDHRPSCRLSEKQRLFSRSKWEEGSRLGTEYLEETCLGDDLVVVLSGALLNYRPRGIAPACELGPGELLSHLEAGFVVSDFEADQLFWDLRNWQRTEGYPLLREWRLRDPLGVLLDQRYWERDFCKLISLKEDRPIALFKMDLDNFKNVNENLGHLGGDEALRLYCETVKSVLGDIAEIYRRGGDEVVAIALLASQKARERAESLRSEIESRFQSWANEKQLAKSPTASIGLVLCRTGEDAKIVIAALDESQQRAKNTGKNKVVEIMIAGPEELP